ncbi:MAG: type II secretion system protein [Gammaproteobacteria bacterium]|nr:MAG: type II secretion system protein [Gammaproteobacteria bacterium]
MKTTMKEKMKGVTLIEIMLVLVVVSMLIVMGVNYTQQQVLTNKIDKTVVDMQQILNGALTYYVQHSTWPCPSGSTCRINDPTVFMPVGSLAANPWGTGWTSSPASGYAVAQSTDGSIFYVFVSLPSSMTSLPAVAQTLTGKLPLSFLTSAYSTAPTTLGSCTTGSSCWVGASVTIPGQNLNNAGNISFAGLYKTGGCVPVPTCPVDLKGNAMTAQVMVVPASVSGVYDAPSNNGGTNCTSSSQTGCSVNVYPLSSFTAFATGGTDNTPKGCTTTTDDPCYGTDYNDQLTGKYWRVCLSVTTQKGTVSPGSSSATNAWGAVEGTVMAVTRCAPQNETTGSSFSVWSQ